MTVDSLGETDPHAVCITKCAEGCALQDLRNRLGVSALNIEELEPNGGMLTDRLNMLHEEMAARCLQHSMNANVYPTLQN